MNTQTNYGNWVPEKMFPPLFGGGAVLLAAGLACGIGLHKTVLAVVLAVLGIILLAYGAYMYRCHEEFAFGKGNMMAKVHEHLVQHLDWDGKGKLLDIGCGAGALTVRCAKAFPEAQLTGMDYWGAEWNYAKDQCERNAKAEGVADRITFEKGGTFSFQDMFSQKGLYGDMDEFVKQLQAEGITEVHFIGNLEQKLDFVPGYVRTPWMISGMGILYGRK